MERDKHMSAWLPKAIFGCLAIWASLSPSHAVRPVDVGPIAEAPIMAEAPLEVRALILRNPVTDIAAIGRFIAAPSGTERPDPALGALKDAALKRLSEIHPLPPEWLSALLDIVEAPQADLTGRVYAFQYATVMYETLARRNAHAANGVALGRLLRGLESSDPWLRGTAILCLGRMDLPEAATDRVREAAWRAAVSETEPPDVRGAAFQICARLGEERALPAARIAARGEKNAVARVSAVHALGSLGDAADRDWLYRAARCPRNAEIRSALTAALTRLDVKLSKNNPTHGREPMPPARLSEPEGFDL